VASIQAKEEVEFSLFFPNPSPYRRIYKRLGRGLGSGSEVCVLAAGWSPRAPGPRSLSWSSDPRMVRSGGEEQEEVEATAEPLKAFGGKDCVRSVKHLESRSGCWTMCGLCRPTGRCSPK